MPPDHAFDVEQQQRVLARFERRFAPGEVVFSDGDPAAEAFLLQEGRVRLLKRVGALERSLRVVKPGDLFGEAALVPGTPHSATAVALETGAALVLDQATFQQVLVSNPAVGARVLQQLVRRLRDAEDQIEILMVRDAQAKCVVAILKLAQQALATSVTPGSVTLAISPMELAARVALDVDTVKRTIQTLRETGYVAVVDERLEIPDVGALRELLGLLGLKDHIAGSSIPRPPAASLR